MHIEKNMFNNIFHTIMDNKKKTKDKKEARMDLLEYCRCKDLQLEPLPNGKWKKPKAKFALTMDQRQDVCTWVEELKMPDGYAFNLARCVDKKYAKLFGIKSHDCHIFMECLLPITFGALPDTIWKPITKLNQFFRDLYVTML